MTSTQTLIAEYSVVIVVNNIERVMVFVSMSLNLGNERGNVVVSSPFNIPYLFHLRNATSLSLGNESNAVSTTTF